MHDYSFNPLPGWLNMATTGLAVAYYLIQIVHAVYIFP